MSSPLIRAENVKKSFGKFTAVDGVSFTVNPGECFGLLGPNGAGKSTLINMLYGTSLRNSGELSVFGFDPTHQSRQIKRRIGVVTQENALDESLSVRENMEIYAAFVELKSSERKKRVRELLEYMSLAHKENDPIRFLSGGMKRRLVFVRALLNSPELVILDEPTTGLDPAVRHLLWGKVNELKSEGKTILLTTHYMHEAEVLCDRLVIMNKGKVISEGSPSALRDLHTPGYVAVFDKADRLNELKLKAEARGFQTNQDSSGLYVRAPQLNALLQFQDENQCPAIQLRPSHLEDVFLKLTGQELASDA
ncbi:MAG: ABC transporter ATP-binding protein [Bdellovibrionales bacterium]